MIMNEEVIKATLAIMIIIKVFVMMIAIVLIENLCSIYSSFFKTRFLSLWVN